MAQQNDETVGLSWRQPITCRVFKTGRAHENLLAGERLSIRECRLVVCNLSCRSEYNNA
jgi:hypothetical protein